MAESTGSAVGLVFDDRYLQHNTGLMKFFAEQDHLPFAEPVLHPSNYRLVWRTKQLLDHTGLADRMTRIEPRCATREEITVYHTLEYYDRVRETCEAGGGEVGLGAPVSRESWTAAHLAAGGVIAAVDAVIDGTVRTAFANVRPPGHHAMSDMGMGFCIFGNVVIAARHAQRVHGLERVMILDWDVHDGNGTQDAFYNDSSVLFFSLHQDRLFPPDFGLLEQTGSDTGTGYTVNIPLPAGSGDATYRAAFEQIVEPVTRQFNPQLIIISAGQDASVMDPLGRMCVTTNGYRMMTEKLMALADELCDGRLVLAQEGGYSEIYAPYCTLAAIETLAGTRSGIAEPLPLEMFDPQPHYTENGTSGKEYLEAALVMHRQHWDL